METLTDSDLLFIATASLEELQEQFRLYRQFHPNDTEYLAALGKKIIERSKAALPKENSDASS